LVKIGKELWT